MSILNGNGERERELTLLKLFVERSGRMDANETMRHHLIAL